MLLNTYPVQIIILSLHTGILVETIQYTVLRQTLVISILTFPKNSTNST